MKILITKIVPYKEHDAIINGFNETGNFSILCKGLLNPKSRNASIANPMTYAEIELADSKSKYDVLKSSNMIFSPMEFIGDAKFLVMFLLIGELINKCLTEDEKVSLFPEILSSLKYIKKKNYPNFYLLRLIAKILNVSGFSFDVDGCHCCGGKKDIIGFSISDGGFICKNCLTNNQDSDYSADELVWIRRIFKQNTEKKIKLEKDVNEDSFKKILRIQIIFIQDNYGLKLANSDLLL